MSKVCELPKDIDSKIKAFVEETTDTISAKLDEMKNNVNQQLEDNVQSLMSDIEGL